MKKNLMFVFIILFAFLNYDLQAQKGRLSDVEMYYDDEDEDKSLPAWVKYIGPIFTVIIIYVSLKESSEQKKS
jgi:hypothetical protein